MSTASHIPATAGHSSYIWSRLGSLLAVAPLGVWTVAHLWNNLAAFQGADAWQSSVTGYAHPVAQLLTLVVVLLPLLIHIVWGTSRITSARPNNGRYGFYGNLKYALQRLSAIGVLFFLGAHIWLAMLHPRLVEGHAEQFGDIAHEMHFHGPTLAVYLLGTMGIAYHFANGMQTFCMGWGVVVSRRALKQLELGVIGLFLVLLAMGWSAIYALWQAGAST